MKESGDPDAPMTVVVGLIGAILIFVVIVLLQALFTRVERGELERKVVAEAPEEFEGLRAEQQAILHGYRVLDPKTGRIGIPVERAMEMIVGGSEAR